MFKTKLIGQGEVSKRAQRRAWSRHRKKVVRLRSKLDEALQLLLGAVTVESLSVLAPFCVGVSQLTRISAAARRNASSLDKTNEILNRIKAVDSRTSWTAREVSLQKTQFRLQDGNRMIEQVAGSSHIITKSLKDLESLDIQQRDSEPLSTGQSYPFRQHWDEPEHADQICFRPLSNAFESLQSFASWTYAVDTRFPSLCRYKTDIYLLGHLLWRIVSNKVTPTRSFFCRVAGCISSRTCTALHADPIDLPTVKEGTPQYLRDIIAACRTEDPSHRPSARMLLDMFPTDLSNVHTDCRAPDHTQRLEELQQRWAVVTCDECGDVIPEVGSARKLSSVSLVVVIGACNGRLSC
jgi:hypothetical protein